MSEFQPINFFTSYNPLYIQDSPIAQASHISVSDEDASDIESESAHSGSTQPCQPSRKTLCSENHNMVKQLIISMKKMVTRHIGEIGTTHTIKTVIRETWKVFTAVKHPTKEILRAMFDTAINRRLLEKVGLWSMVQRFDLSVYAEAMNELKLEILFRMRESCLLSHLSDRKIQKKERLGAYIQYFLNDEMKSGKVTHRFGESASRRIEEILAQTRRENDFIDYCLEGYEV